jgi:hypothetical protein
LLRGLAVFLGRSIRTPDALYAAHRRFDAWTVPVRDAVIGALLVVAVVAGALVAPSLAIVLALLTVAVQLSGRRRAPTGVRPRSGIDARPMA